MKKIYSFFILCFSLTLSAQLTESNHAPSPGNNFELYDCDPTGIDPGPAGANVQWTFAGTTTTVAPVAYVTMTVNNPQYPAAKVGVAASASNSAYYRSDQNMLVYYGGNIPVPQAAAEFIYTQPAIKAVYPMSLNTSSSSAIAGSVNVTVPLPTSGTFSGNCSAVCDGTGTLTVAGHSTPNVYRVVTTQTINFTTSLGGGTLDQKNYDYYEPDTKAPLFSISITTVVAFAQTNTRTIVSRLKSYVGTGIDELNLADQLRIFPNPATSEIKLNSPDKDYVLRVFDITGKLVNTTTLKEGLNRMDVSGFVKGLYVYKIEDAEGTVKSTGKLTIIQ